MSNVETQKMPVDQLQRDVIQTELDRTLFVNAGAGAGKTFLMVRRIGALLKRGTPIESIAAITFTEAAATELSVRVREHLQKELKSSTTTEQEKRHYSQALKSIDNAAITTLHGFAKRILAEFGLDAGLAARNSVVDEITSQLNREKRWKRFANEIYENADNERVLSLAYAIGINVEDKYRRSFKDVIEVLYKNWDRLTAVEPVSDSAIDRTVRVALDDLDSEITELRAVAELCVDASDALFIQITSIVAAFENLEGSYARLSALAELKEAKPRGRQASWGSGSKEDQKAIQGEAQTARNRFFEKRKSILASVAHQVLAHLAWLCSKEVNKSVESRKAEGVLEFHDLLVHTKQLLLDSTRARSILHRRYRHLLLDESQDTDPIQVEIATLIAAADEDITGKNWDEFDIPEGSLFFVGDPKQSIYRFRRADIKIYESAQNLFGQGLQELSQNFRTVGPILDWVNAVVGNRFGLSETQTDYLALEAFREVPDDISQRSDFRPLLFGGPTEAKSAELQVLESNDIADIISDIRNNPEKWPVFDKDKKCWRDASLADVTILIPVRSGLKALETALNEAEIEYQLKTGALLFDSQEVRDITEVIKAIDNPADEIALVAALRSPFYGCSDVDLFHWKKARHEWDISRAVPEELTPETEHVAECFTHLRTLWEQRWFLTPSQIINRLVSQRHALLSAFGDSNPTGVWGNYRFIAEAALQFEQAGGSSLRDFTDWVQLRRDSDDRIHEAASTDSESQVVNIGTMHGSKGLEYPITILAGMSKEISYRDPPVLFDDENNLHISMYKGLVSDGYGEISKREALLELDESVRLLYVAATRARDHLIVSCYHNSKWAGKTPESKTFAGMVWYPFQSLDQPELVRETNFWKSSENPSDNRSPNTRPEQQHGSGISGAAPKSEVGLSRGQWIENRQQLINESHSQKVLSATAIANLVNENFHSDAVSTEATDTPPSATSHTADSAAPQQPSAASAASKDLANASADVAVPARGVGVAVSAGSAGGHKPTYFRQGARAKAIGDATHKSLESLDFNAIQAEQLASEENRNQIREVVQHHCDFNNISTEVDLVEGFVVDTLGSDAIALARKYPHFKELFIAQEITNDSTIEGYVDLLIDTPEGYVIIDYKTEAARSDKALAEALEKYSPQGAAYCVALEERTGKTVKECRFIFLNKSGAKERSIENLEEAKAQVRQTLAQRRR